MFKEKNLVSTINPNLNISEFEYFKLKELIGRRKALRIYGFMFNESKFGKSVTVFTNEFGVNIPSRCVEWFEDLTNEEVEAVKEGKLVLTNFKEKTTDRGDTVIFDYEDLENMSKDFINETEIAVE